MRPGITTKFAFASTTLLLSLLFAVPLARSAEGPKLLYAIVDTNFDAPTPPSSVFDPPTLIAANLGAIHDGGFRVGVIGSTRAPSAIALAICPPEGEKAAAYTIANTFSPSNQLAGLDLSTGTATLVGSPIFTELDIMALTCSPDGTLYAIGQSQVTKPAFNSLYKVDRNTGAATPIGPTGVLDPSDFSGFSGFLLALAFAPDGTLYGVSDRAIGSGSILYSLRLSDGHATFVANINVDAVMGLAIDEERNFYVADYVQQSKIYALHSVTGMATPIQDTHLGLVNNIAFKYTPR
jgi:hypothetical protein